MATATFNLGDATFTAPTTGEAQAKRDAALLDFCKNFGLDIYVPGTQTVDPAKVAPAVKAQVLVLLRRILKQYRAEQSAATQINLPDEF